MENPAYYWQLVRLTSAGTCQFQEHPALKTWLQATFAPWFEAEPPAEATLQGALLAQWREGHPNAAKAELSLRCYISHHIQRVALRLVKRYGHAYNLAPADLYPALLEDDGRPLSSEPGATQPLSQKILATYDPQRATLATWSRTLAQNHSSLTQRLLEKGLYRVSDWALLNDTHPEQLARILRQYHLCSEYEVAQGVALLTDYQRVYWRDRLQQRQTRSTGVCPAPTVAQLQEMQPQVPPPVLRRHLNRLARQLRDYRLHVRSGNPMLYQPQDEDELERLSERYQSLPADDDNEEETAFLRAYEATQTQGLARAIEGVLTTNLQRLRRQGANKAQGYLQGLHLRLCQGLSMGKLAAQIGLQSQVQVSRLLNLKRLRADVRHRFLNYLQTQVRELALTYRSPEQLQAIDQTLDALLTQTVDTLLEDAAAEVQAPTGQVPRSSFARQLCLSLHAFLEDPQGIRTEP